MLDPAFDPSGPTPETPEPDAAEQHQPTDPLDITTPAAGVSPPLEADPGDVAEQAEVIALDDELRAEPTSTADPDGLLG